MRLIFIHSKMRQSILTEPLNINPHQPLSTLINPSSTSSTLSTLTMSEQQPTDFRIETVIGKDGLDPAFERFSQLVKLFDQMELNIRQLQGQMTNLKYENNAGMLGADDHNLVLNRIRHAFLSELEQFKSTLPQYLNSSQPELLMRGVSDQVQIVMEVMGQRLRGYYDIERQISEGNSALVFLLKDVFTQRRVVTKVLKVPVLSDEIKAEIGAVSQLKHRNIIKLLGESLDRFPFYVICEFVNGPTLPVVLKNRPSPGFTSRRLVVSTGRCFELPAPEKNPALQYTPVQNLYRRRAARDDFAVRHH